MASRWKALIPALLLLVAWFSTDFLLVLKSYVDLLCIGYSSSKTLTFLLFLTLLGVFSWMPPLGAVRWHRAYAGGLGLLHGLALVEHTLFVRAVGRPWWSQLMVIGDGHLTSTKPTHLHEPKAALAWLTGYRGDMLDSGSSFLPYFPTALLVVHAALILLVALLGFLMAHQFLRNHPSGAGLTMAMAVFAAAKASIDGGPLSSESLLPLPFMLLLLQGRGWLVPVLSLATPAIALSLWAYGGDPVFQFLKITGALALLGAPLLWDVCHRQPDSKSFLLATAVTLWVLAVPLLTFLGSGQARRPPFPLGTLRYLHRRLEPGQTVYLHHRQPLKPRADAPYQPVRTYRGRHLWTSEVKLTRSTTTAELTRDFANNPHHFPATWASGTTTYEFVANVSPDQLRSWKPTEHITESHLTSAGPGLSKLELSLRGGANMDVAVDSLPPGNYVLTHFRILSHRPDSDPE